MREYEESDLENMNPCDRQEPTDQLYNKICQIWKNLLYSNTMLFSKIEPSWGKNQSNRFLFVILLIFVTGKMIRRRTINQPFQGDGRPCPSQMEQFKPCPVKPCYRWQYGQWSPCKVEVKAIWDFEVMDLEDPGIFVMYPDTSLSTL